MRPPLVLAIALALPLAACRHGRAPSITTASTIADAAGLVERVALPRDHALAGVSDLTHPPDGESDLYYAIPERFRALIALRIPAGPLAPAVQKILPLDGVPDDLDTESLAALGAGHFAAGTESTSFHRATDEIFFIDATGDTAHATRHIAVPWTAWGEKVRAEHNRGIEALCAVDGTLWLAGEFTWTEEGARVAPLGRVDPATAAVTPFRLRLTSGTGKISALACRRTAAGTLEAVAVERHYGVARLLRFPLPAAAQPDPITPTLALDLAPLLKDLPNIEGIAFDGDDHVLLITDNVTAIETGPTEVLRVRL